MPLLLQTGDETMRIKTKGSFVRTREVWTPEKWNDGYTDNRGRFRIYRPDYPRAYSEGYCLRAHVVWWLKHGEPHPKNEELHHIDKSKDNDRIENLISLSKSEHRKIHQKADYVNIVCKNCGISFNAKKHRVKSRGVLFCSQSCYQSYPKPFRKQIRLCAECGEQFIVIPSSARLFCSNSCAQFFTWRKRKCEEF